MAYPECNANNGPVGARCHEHKHWQRFFFRLEPAWLLHLCGLFKNIRGGEPWDYPKKINGHGKPGFVSERMLALLLCDLQSCHSAYGARLPGRRRQLVYQFLQH